MSTRSEQLLHVHRGHLDRLQGENGEGRDLLPLFIEVIESDDAPDPASEQFLVLLDDIGRDNRILDAEVGELRLVNIFLLVKFDPHLVDHFETAAFTDQRLDLLCLIGTHVVLGQDFFDVLQPLPHDLIIIGGTIHAEQVFQHIDRDVSPFLELFGQILANHLSLEVAVQTGIQIQADMLSQLILWAQTSLNAVLLLLPMVSTVSAITGIHIHLLNHHIVRDMCYRRRLPLRRLFS